MGHNFIVAFGDGETPIGEVDGKVRVGSIEGLAGVVLTASVHPVVNKIEKNRKRILKYQRYRDFVKCIL
jgi:hypothetical protein